MALRIRGRGRRGSHGKHALVQKMAGNDPVENAQQLQSAAIVRRKVFEAGPTKRIRRMGGGVRGRRRIAERFGFQSDRSYVPGFQSDLSRQPQPERGRCCPRLLHERCDVSSIRVRHVYQRTASGHVRVFDQVRQRTKTTRVERLVHPLAYPHKTRSHEMLVTPDRARSQL